MRAYHPRLLNATTHEIAVAMATMVGRPPNHRPPKIDKNGRLSLVYEDAWRKSPQGYSLSVSFRTRT
jgi:hypothetical protein